MSEGRDVPSSGLECPQLSMTSWIDSRLLIIALGSFTRFCFAYNFVFIQVSASSNSLRKILLCRILSFALVLLPRLQFSSRRPFLAANTFKAHVQCHFPLPSDSVCKPLSQLSPSEALPVWRLSGHLPLEFLEIRDCFIHPPSPPGA